MPTALMLYYSGLALLLILCLALEYENSITCKEDTLIVIGYGKVTALKLNGYLIAFFTEAVFHSGYYSGTCTCTAGKGFTVTSFVSSHLKSM